MPNILNMLKGGSRRSIGRSEEVVALISEDPALFSQLFAGLLHSDPVIRMRVADAVEKLSRSRPNLLQPFKSKLLRLVAEIPQKEVRWHVAQILPRLKMNSKEKDMAVAILFEYLEDKSSIVRTFSMQALADLAEKDARLRKRVVPLLEFLTSAGTPAMRARGRMLLRRLGRSLS